MNLSINALLLIRSLPLNSTCLWTLSLTGQHSSPTSLLYLWAASQYLPTFLIEFLSPSLFTRFESPSGISFRTSSGFIYSAWAPTGFSRTCFFSSSSTGFTKSGALAWNEADAQNSNERNAVFPWTIQLYKGPAVSLGGSFLFCCCD